MASVPQPDHVEREGNWEDIVRAGQPFAGRRVRVATVNDATDSRRLREGADRVLDQIDQTIPDPNPLPLQGSAAEFAEGVAADLRRQGIEA